MQGNEPQELERKLIFTACDELCQLLFHVVFHADYNLVEKLNNEPDVTGRFSV